MSAGSGLEHSEKNASATDEVNFLQIWVFPKLENISPRYDQKLFSADDRQDKFQTVVSPERNEKSLWINQDAWFSLGNLKKGRTTEYSIQKKGNGIYAFIIEGDASLNEMKLNKRDGLGVWETDKLSITTDSDAEVLLIEVPMTEK